jgi:hypothetical protein
MVILKTMRGDYNMKYYYKLQKYLKWMYIDIITYPDVDLPRNMSDTTKVLVELDISTDEFIKMGLKEKIIQVLNK